MGECVIRVAGNESSRPRAETEALPPGRRCAPPWPPIFSDFTQPNLIRIATYTLRPFSRYCLGNADRTVFLGNFVRLRTWSGAAGRTFDGAGVVSVIFSLVDLSLLDPRFCVFISNSLKSPVCSADNV